MLLFVFPNVLIVWLCRVGVGTMRKIDSFKFEVISKFWRRRIERKENTINLNQTKNNQKFYDN